MNYEKEYETVTNNVSTFKAEVGSYTFEVLEEPIETEYVDDEGNKTPQIKMLIKVKDRKYNFFISKGSTTESLYGQLIVIGRHYGGLKGRLIQMFVKQGKDRKSYTLPDALNLMQQEQTL